MNAYGTNYLILVNKEYILRNITVISSVIGFFSALVFISTFSKLVQPLHYYLFGVCDHYYAMLIPLRFNE